MLESIHDTKEAYYVDGTWRCDLAAPEAFYGCRDDHLIHLFSHRGRQRLRRYIRANIGLRNDDPDMPSSFGE